MKSFSLEIDIEADGRYIAEIPEIPGAMAYGISKEEAVAKAEALAFRILASRLENGEIDPFDQHELPFKAA